MSLLRRETWGPRSARRVSGVVVCLACFARAVPVRAEEPPPPGALPPPRRPKTAAPPPEPPGDPPPNIVPPRQTKFVEAEYPPEAKAEGLEGTVILSLDIDTSGKVTRAVVTQPAGHGFDEAAREAALGFEFEPATRDGKPIAVRIPYRYVFSIKEVEKPAEQAPPTVGNLGGVVLVANVDAPLAAAEIDATGPDGLSRKVVADSAGKWMIEGVPPGRYSVHVTAPGFLPLDAAEDVVAGQATELTYRLSPRPAGVEVSVTGARPQRDLTRRTIERREMERIPGTSGDALRSIQSLPGVARPPAFAGLLIVRGSAPSDTQVFIDGASVPLIYHFGGLSSTIPTELLDRIDFYPSNFSARYGLATGGIVDVGLREPNTVCTEPYGKPSERTGCFHALAQLDLIDARLLVQGPIGKHWTFAVGGRRSWLDAWLAPVLTSTGATVSSAPVYYDYQVIADTKPSQNSRLSLRFYGSDDRLRLIVSDPAQQEPAFGGDLSLGTSYYRAQALYEADLSRRVSLYAMAAAGQSRLDFGVGAIRFSLDLHPINVRSELGFQLLRGLKLFAGIDFLISPYSVFVRGPAPPRPGEPARGPFATSPLLQTSQSATIFRPGYYLEAQIRPNRRSLITPGFRIDHASDSGHTDYSPRLNARYDIVGGPAEADRPPEDRRRRTTLKAGVGVYQQPPQLQETNPVFGTPGLSSSRAIQYAVGVEQEITRQIDVSLEAYYKDLQNLVTREPSLSSLYVYDNAGSGYVIGSELLVRYRPDARFFGWLAYTLSRSVRRDRPGAPEHLSQYDQTQNLTVLGSYRLGHGWELGARFRIISGPLVTPVSKGVPPSAVYAADSGAYTPLQGPPYSERLPLFNQLDVRVDKSWQFPAWRLSAYLDVQNAYNNPAKESLRYNFNFTRSTYATGLPILPNIGVRGEF
jgi:TonB family protein